MKVWGCRLFLAALATAALVPAATAEAARRPAQQPTATFSLKAGHGYRFTAAISPGYSTLSVIKGGRRAANVEDAQYVSQAGALKDGKFEADFGHLGRIAVRFTATKKPRHFKAPGYGGGTAVRRFGVFEGTIRFNGEHGYTSVDSARAEGTIDSLPHGECSSGVFLRKRRGHSGEKRRGPLVTTFRASSEKQGVYLDASQLEAEPIGSTVFAVSIERGHGITIFRTVMVIGVGAGFNAPADLNSATLAPSAPFSGSADFDRIDAYATRWEGPLAVSFPGRPDVPLTGPSFTWGLSSAPANESGSFGVSFASSGIQF